MQIIRHRDQTCQFCFNENTLFPNGDVENTGENRKSNISQKDIKSAQLQQTHDIL